MMVEASDETMKQQENHRIPIEFYEENTEQVKKF